MSHLLTSRITRRAWLDRHAVAMAGLSIAGRRDFLGSLQLHGRQRPANTPGHTSEIRPRQSQTTMAEHAPSLMQGLARDAVEAATAVGTQYADARVTRTVMHTYDMGAGKLITDSEMVGIGVRALVNGYWGFAASPVWTADEAAQLAQDAAALARENAKGPVREVDLGTVPVVTGTWQTPIRIDPFTVSMEEKIDFMTYWGACAKQAGTPYVDEGFGSVLVFVRQERVLATSAGSLVTQTLYESCGELMVESAGIDPFFLQQLDWSGKGWELFLDAKIPEQFVPCLAEARALAALKVKSCEVGRYTVVCDGATMASLVGRTLGPATQLDRALGYEANAGGTSFLDDPLAMVGTTPIASPLLTVTANRSRSAELATVQWDDEGVTPRDVTLVKDGVPVDFQTTRESAAWLAPYYRAHGKPVQSSGYAGASDALAITMQHMPNLALAPSPTPVQLEDLVASVPKGLLLVGGQALQVDFQLRNGLLGSVNGMGYMREITNGRLGARVQGGLFMFNTMDLWRNLSAIGGSGTAATVGNSGYDIYAEAPPRKGQPPQRSSFSVQGVAAMFKEQSLIDPKREA